VDEPLAVTVSIDPEHHRGPIDRRLVGTFVEHLGRCVYGGIFEPGHPRADQHGFRVDVADLVRELGVTLVRYPGGNFVSGYRWEDGIGPGPERPRRLDLAWRSIEPNTVGTDEFLGWTARLGLEPMLAVNLGTRGIQEAADLVEYCNVAEGTAWSDRRRANGVARPHGVRLWCLGNEMDGPWQIGHKSAEEYGRLATETAKAMKLVDPGIELVVCGSSGRDMPTFGQWESTVLEHAYDVVEYVSLHAYYEPIDGDRRSFLASGAAMHAFIADVLATTDAVGARKRSRRRLRLSFDEWNVWYLSQLPGNEETEPRLAPTLLEQVYNGLDAVVVGDLLITLVNNADRVAIGCLAQLVNAIAPIMTETRGPAWRQAIFHPFAHTAAAVAGPGRTAPRSLVATIRAPQLATARHGDVPAVSAAATHDPEPGAVSVFLVNRSGTEAEVTLRHPGFADLRLAMARTIRAGDADVATTGAVPLTGVMGDGSATTLRLPPESWTVLTRRAPRDLVATAR
jgi:alpha-N-arabinofuranosidase